MQNLQYSFITNKSTIRYLRILNSLERSKYCTAAFLSKITKSSERTINSDISFLRDTFNDSVELISTKNGYKMTKKNFTLYLKSKQGLLDNEPLFIILSRIFFRELQSVGEWSDELHLSEDTLLKYLKNIRKYLKSFNLSLSFSPLNFIGEEIDIRNFYYAFYYESEISPYTIFPSETVKTITPKIIDILGQEYDQKALSFFNYLFYFSFIRSSLGCKVHVNNHSKELVQQDPNYSIFLNSMSVNTDPTIQDALTKDEYSYLFTLITCRRKTNNIEAEYIFYRTYGVYPEIDQIVAHLCSFIKENSDDRITKPIFLKSFFLSEKLLHNLSPYTNRETADLKGFVKNRFHKEYQLCTTFFAQEEAFSTLFINIFLEDMSCKLVLFLQSLKETYVWSPQNIAFIFEGNTYMCQYYKSWITKYISRFHQVFFPSADDLNLDYFKRKKID